MSGGEIYSPGDSNIYDPMTGALVQSTGLPSGAAWPGLSRSIQRGASSCAARIESRRARAHDGSSKICIWAVTMPPTPLLSPLSDAFACSPLLPGSSSAIAPA